VEDIVKEVALLWNRRVQRVVTSWATGRQVTIDVTDKTFATFLTDVGESFAFENPRVYLLQNSKFKMEDRIELDDIHLPVPLLKCLMRLPPSPLTTPIEVNSPIFVIQY
jgi:hypothetical protein